MTETRRLLSPTQLRPWLDAAREVATIGGARALEWWAKRTTLTVEQKGKNDWVSEADRDVERTIIAALKQRFPDHAFLGEEQSKETAKPGQPLWVIDPIDGTTNFLRGVPLFAVSVACVVGGEPLVGVIRLPLHDETFAAARGQGATLNGAPIGPSKVARLDESVVALGSNRKSEPGPVAASYARLIEAGVEVRRLGSACAATCYVACGRVDGYLEQQLSPWDVAAGLVIVEEAGARANDYATGEWLTKGGPWVCAPPQLFERVRTAAGF
ncbi:MAG: inositol monophosphatase [Deltaproteobacteria bacterium]|nr:inositol monophosphatase [Deltaproteobacteria bacterium]